MNKLLQLIQNNARADKAPGIRAEAGKVYIYDVIDRDWGASAKALIDALTPMAGQSVELHINSPGGDVFEARAMVAAVRAHGGKVTTYIDGLAASAATYLALAGDEVHMSDGSLFMVHNSWTLSWGNKHEMRTTADLLDKIDGTIASDYANKTGASAEQIAAWMDAETWFTATEAQAAGFVDQIDGASDGGKAARWNLSAYANAPKPTADPEQVALAAQAQADAAERLTRLNRSRLALLDSQN
jgi:ATP-dependent Clp protease protease subunit